MKRCLANGREGFELWVGAAVLANDLMVIAALMNKPKRRKPQLASRAPVRAAWAQRT
jgi:hypothetical protein